MKLITIPSFATIASAIVLVLVSHASAQTVALTVGNADFSQPNLGGSGYTTNNEPVPDWVLGTTEFYTGVEYEVPYFNPGAVPTASGQAAYANAYGTFSQTLSSDPGTLDSFEPGSYQFTVDIGWKNGTSFGGGTIGLFDGSTQVAAFDLTAPTTIGTFQPETLSYLVTDTDPNIGQPITIELAGGTSGSTLFANVALDYTSASVPEPSSLLLFCGGFGLMFAIRHFRKAFQAY